MGNPMVLLTGAGLAVVCALFVFLMPARHRLAGMALLAVPQIVLPGVIESATVFQLWVAGSGVVLALRDKPRMPSAVTKLLVALALWSLVAALWSPLKNIAVIAAVQMLSMWVVALHAALAARDHPQALRRAVRLLGLGVAAESFLVVLFRVNPAVEAQFLASPVANLLVGTEKLAGFFTGSPDNVLDPLKSGGLWLNANTASMFLGVAACAFISLGARLRAKSYYTVGLIAAAAVLFAGSKTGIVLVLAMPVLALLVAVLARRSARVWVLPVVLVAYPAFLVLNALVDAVLPESFAADSAYSLSTRNVIWDAATLMFGDNRVLGLGYGGWGEAFSAYSGGALGRSFPPHNIIIAAWADAGLVGATLLVLFIAAVVVTHFRQIDKAAGREIYALAFSLGAFLWLFIHGMADAVTFYGDLRTMVLPALLLGIILADQLLPAGPEKLGRSSITGRLSSLAPSRRIK